MSEETIQRFALNLGRKIAIVRPEKTDNDDIRVRVISVNDTRCSDWRCAKMMYKDGTVLVARKGEPEFDEYEFGATYIEDEENERFAFNMYGGKILLVRPQKTLNDDVRVRIISVNDDICLDWRSAKMMWNIGTLLIGRKDEPDYDEFEWSGIYLLDNI